MADSDDGGAFVCRCERAFLDRTQTKTSGFDERFHWRNTDMTVTGIISALIVGLVIGALGRLVVPGRQNIGILVTMVVGVVAALIGTAIARATGVADTNGVDWIELLFQVVLAALGVFLVAGLMGRRRSVR
jgi:uncharacterized membrane protein YeaQ/YmgE (transglycosylase-associated protein family)